MLADIKKWYEQETAAERRQRMIPAATFGALVATTYVWALSLVNILSFPELPLAVDWLPVIGRWMGLSLAFGFFGALAAWFTEEYAGAVGGGLIFTALLAFWSLIAAQAQNSTVTAQSIITTLPLAGVNLLAAWGLRWSARRFLMIQHESDARLRHRQLLGHVGMILLVGLVPGLLGRMDPPAQRTLGQLHQFLQAAPNDPSVWPRLPLRQVPSLQDHFGEDYVFYAHPSLSTISTLDVSVRFEDGFVLHCLLPVSTTANFITECTAGK